VFPINPESKKPYAGGNGYHDATTTADDIRDWWTVHPDSRIGIALRPSGLIAIDCDGSAGLALLAKLESEVGALPRVCHQRSGSGGEHILLRDPSPGEDGWTRVGGELRGNLGGAGIIDVKCNGYIVVAPSGKYQWLALDPHNVPAVPTAWLEVLRKPTEMVTVEAPPVVGELAERVERGRRAIANSLVDIFPQIKKPEPRPEVVARERQLRDVLAGRPFSDPLGTGHARVNKLAIAIGRIAPDIGADACTEIMRATVSKLPNSQRLLLRAADGYDWSVTHTDAPVETPSAPLQAKPPWTPDEWEGLAPPPGAPGRWTGPSASGRAHGANLLAGNTLRAACVPDEEILSLSYPDLIARAREVDHAARGTLIASGQYGSGDAATLAVAKLSEVEMFARARSLREPAAETRAPSSMLDLSKLDGAPRPVSILASDVIADIRARSNERAALTPWSRFNEMSGGLPLTSITVLIGFQGSGKSSFAAQLGAYHSEHTGWTVYYLGEMTARILAARIIGQRTKRSWLDVLKGKLTDEEMRAALAPLRLRIVPRHADPIAAMRQTIDEIREQDHEHPIMLVVDYAQLLAVVRPDMRVSNTEAVRAVQALIEDEKAGIIGVLLSQTSRGNSKRIREGTEDSIDLADTGAETAELERSATLQVVLSYQQKDDTRVHEVTLAITKRRFGGPTKLYMDYDGEVGVFAERSSPVKNKAEQEREDAILEALRVHQDGTCNGHPNSQCVARITQNTLHAGFGVPKLHKVGGNKGLLGKTLKRLESENKVAKVGVEYTLVNRGGKS
jgi:replicative DNA helicase